MELIRNSLGLKPYWWIPTVQQPPECLGALGVAGQIGYYSGRAFANFFMVATDPHLYGHQTIVVQEKTIAEKANDVILAIQSIPKIYHEAKGLVPFAQEVYDDALSTWEAVRDKITNNEQQSSSNEEKSIHTYDIIELSPSSQA